MANDPNDQRDSDPTDQITDPDPGPVSVRHSWTQSAQPSITVPEAVAAATNRHITDLPSLQEIINTDALDRLLTGQSSPVDISFHYADTEVTVRGNGSIEVQVEDLSTAGDHD